LDVVGINLFDGGVVQVFLAATGNPPIGIGFMQARSNATEQCNANEQSDRKIVFDCIHQKSACYNQK
jgi:hypothetical protein